MHPIAKAIPESMSAPELPPTSRRDRILLMACCVPRGSRHSLNMEKSPPPAEARRYAAEMADDSKIYPVVYFKSDTTGEKGYEEFYVPGERLNLERFSSLGVIEDVSKRPLSELDSFFDDLESLFALPDCHKSDIVTALKRFLPNFEHVEKGKNLDQKM